MSATVLEQSLPLTSDIPTRQDTTVRWLGLVATLLSVTAFTFFHSIGATLIYWDSVSHMQISRRVIDGPTPGFGQLGSVWLPLPHLLMLPFVWVDGLYFSGLAGSIVSMAAFIATVILLYKITYRLTNHKAAGLVTAAVFMLNPNVLYMQSTPMSELLLFACMAGMVYGVQRWIQSEENKYLLGAGTAGLLGTSTRYEAWVLLGALAGVVLYTAWRKKGWTYAEGTTLSFLLIGGFGIVVWLGWNLLIFGDILNFLNGEYAKSSLWIESTDPVIGHPLTAVKAYFYATTGNLGAGVSLLLGIALVTLAVCKHRSAAVLPTLTMLALFPFFAVTLMLGQRPIHVQQINGGLVNVRFGLLMVLPAAILAGVVVNLISRRSAPAAVICAVLAAYTAWNFAVPDRIVTYREPHSDRDFGLRVMSRQVSDFLASNYRGETILMESFGNEFVLIQARIGTADNIYEGSYKLWEPTLADPAGQDVQWIIMRPSGLENQQDKVYASLKDSPQLEKYQIAFSNDNYIVYERRTSP